METIDVHVVKYADRKNYLLRYRCPMSGKYVTKSAETSERREAERAAARWETELREGRYSRGRNMAWQEFVDFVEDYHLATMKPRSRTSYRSTLNVLERECSPKRLSDVTTAKVTHLCDRLRKQGRSPATIAGHLQTLAAILRWAKRQGVVSTLPDCTVPKGTRRHSGMKGRPITLEEFERMLGKVRSVVDADADADADAEDGKDSARVRAWKFYLRALWASGLRLSESLTLSWDDRPDAITVDLSGRRPMLRVPADVEKGNRDRLLPMTPELAELLESVPAHKRRGRVFQGVHRHPVNVSKAVCAIGKAAKVIVRPAVGEEGEPGYKPPKYASAHDLRRAFGTRWSRKLSPARLMAIMRHEDISTTMRYYVAEASEELADVLWSESQEAATETATAGQN